ncbi:MAG TPA: cupin domain-containing protein [Acidimicrobiales bacterium]|nr:cupin domain-containing protein [Acidimicrobiales bacterium]
MTSAYEEALAAPELLELARDASSPTNPEARRVFVRELAGRYSEIYKSIFAAPRVIHSRDAKYGGGPQHYNKNVIDPTSPDASQLFHCHIELMAPGARSQKHGHMNTAVFYILEGEGLDVHDGVEIPWKAGDIAIVEPGCVHQHFNLDRESHAKMLVMKAKPLYLFANLGFQGFVEASPKEPVPGFEHYLPDEIAAQGGPVTGGGE